jgi:anti-sigma B factor antagonist
VLLTIERPEEPRVIRLIGEIDISNAEEVSTVVERDLASDGDLVLDLTGLAFIDSTGIQVLVDSARRLEGRGRLLLKGAGEPIRRVLALVGLPLLPNVVLD